MQCTLTIVHLALFTQMEQVKIKEWLFGRLQDDINL
jgi:hypothetical protein